MYPAWHYPALGAVAGLVYGLGTWNLVAGVLFGMVAAASFAASSYFELRHPEGIATYRRAVWKAAPIIVILGLAGFVWFLVEL